MSKKATRLTAEELGALTDDTDGRDLVSKSREVKAVDFAELEEFESTREASQPVDFLWDVPMTIEVILGGTSLSVREVLDIGPGTVIELERGYGEPVDILLNGRVVARGEVVVIGEHFGVKITEILVSGDEMVSMASGS